MRTFITRFRVIVAVMLILIVAGTIYILQSARNKVPDWITETVSRGEVANIVSVSGIVRAENTASLSFPIAGIISEISVREGDAVLEGQVLAILEQSELIAERKDAQSALNIAEANLQELMNGPRSEERQVTDIAVEIARDELERVKAEEAEKVRNAHRILLSNSIEAFPVDSTNDNTPPTITGTYGCDDEGAYTLSIFRSGSQSGYSYRLDGLENGTFTAYAESAAPLGTCGLMIQFAKGENYSSKDWNIPIPNVRSATYSTYVTAYTLSKQQEANRVAAATQAYEQARRTQTLENAAPRTEAIARAEAAVAQASARLLQVDARIEHRVLRAPFSGVISDIDIVRGETVSTNPVMTMLADDNFELTVRVPEIDVTKIAIGQSAEAVFDARRSEIVPASIAFISPLATMIDGVAYFEAKLRFVSPPSWLRGGLNADVDIIVDKREDVLRIPKRFLIQEQNGTYSVLTPNGTRTATTGVSVGFMGNDGFVEITGLAEGAAIIAP